MDVFGCVTTPLSALSLVLLFTVIFLYCLYMSQNYDFFKSRGIKGPRPIPPFGNFWLYLRKGMRIADIEYRNQYGNFFGLFQGSRPVLIVSEPDLLKQILVKDFSSFTDRIHLKLSGVINDWISLKTGRAWHEMRKVITPSFSTGKLKRMMGLINQSCDTLVKNIQENSRLGKAVDLKKYCGAFTMDVIASTTCSMQIDSRSNPNNVFVKNAKKITQCVDPTSPKLLLIFFMPFLTKIVNLNLVPSHVVEFYRRITKQLLQERSSNKQEFTDLLQLMMKASEEEIGKDISKGSDADKQGQVADVKKGLTEDEIMAQIMLFFFAGYDTTATTLSFALINLAGHPRCMEKAFDEVNSKLQGKEITYDDLKDFEYLEMCILETLRLYPPVMRIDREATKNTEIEGISIPKGTAVTVPIYAIHHDPKIWENPEEFKPERFLPDERWKHSTFDHMPFGYGPRNCIGMRLALAEIKTAMARLIQGFKFSVSKGKQFPINLEKHSGILRASEPLLVNVEERS